MLTYIILPSLPTGDNPPPTQQSPSPQPPTIQTVCPTSTNQGETHPSTIYSGTSLYSGRAEMRAPLKSGHLDTQDNVPNP